MIADDLTGALDAGVAFAAAGISTCVCQGSSLAGVTGEYAVLVCGAETRHLPPTQAYETVASLVRQGMDLGYGRILKKTDSALRGNVGAEIAAAVDASGSGRAYFLPAYPKMNRITRQGVHYIDGNVPVGQSVFARDPFDPVTCSEVRQLIGQTTDMPAALGAAGASAPEGIAIYDAQSDQDLLETARWILSQPDAVVLAGCAGLAGVLPQLLQLERREAEEPLPTGNLMVFCGSVNPISLAQCQEARDGGAPSFQLITDGHFANGPELAWQIAASARCNPVTVFETGSSQVLGEDPAASGKIIATKVGAIIRDAVELAPDAILAVIGGDTLLAFLQQLSIVTIYPVRELFPGVVLAKYFYQGKQRYLISKSGGFGGRDLLRRLQEKLDPRMANDNREVYSAVAND